MNGFKVIKIDLDSNSLEFDNGVILTSEHDSDCCERHYLSLADLTLEDFKDLEFDLSSDALFTPLEGYGIALNPIKGFPIRIPGYGSNNGYYSSELILVLKDENRFRKTYDITDCQNISK